MQQSVCAIGNDFFHVVCRLLFLQYTSPEQIVKSSKKPVVIANLQCAYMPCTEYRFRRFSAVRTNDDSVFIFQNLKQVVRRNIFIFRRQCCQCIRWILGVTVEGVLFHPRSEVICNMRNSYEYTCSSPEDESSPCKGKISKEKKSCRKMQQLAGK